MKSMFNRYGIYPGLIAFIIIQHISIFPKFIYPILKCMNSISQNTISGKLLHVFVTRTVNEYFLR